LRSRSPAHRSPPLFAFFPSMSRPPLTPTLFPYTTLFRSNIGVLEKAEALGEHCLSGAVVNPRAFRDLFPDLRDGDFPFRGPVTKERVALLTSRRAFTLPTPPTMHNAGNYVASLCEIVRWLGERATALGVNVFT